MNDKYLSEWFEGDFPTQLIVKKTASRIVYLPKGILIFLIALLACVSSYVCSEAFAEDQAMVDTKIDIPNKPINFFELYKWQILGGIALLIAEALLILFLLINIRRRKSAEHQLKGEIAGHKVTEKSLSEQEAKLKNSEKRFRNLMEQSPLDIVVFTPEGRISEVNAAWMRNWDVDEEEKAKVLSKYNMRTDRQLEDLGLAALVEKAYAGEAVVLPPMEYIGAVHARSLGWRV